MTFIRYCTKHKPKPVEGPGLSMGERFLRAAMEPVDYSWLDCKDCRVLSGMVFEKPKD